MSFIRKIAAKIGFGDRRRDGRVLAGDLDVSYWTGVEKKRVMVRDVSPTGIYIFTDDQWLPGTSVLLTMRNAHRQTLFEGSPRPEVRLPAKAIRIGEDGVGLTFVQDHIKISTWLKLMHKATTMVAHSDAVRVFRVTKALAFLLRVSPKAEAQVLKLITEQMGLERAELAIEIVLKAEEILVSQHRELASDVSPALIMRILTVGTEIGEQRLQQSWAGLLAVVCLEDSTAESVQSFVTMLSSLDPSPVRMLSAGCTKAMQVGWKAGFVFSEPILCTLDEIKKIAGTRTMIGIEQDLNRLYEMGLLHLTKKPNALARIEQANLTPTALGLQLYARCTGQTELPDALDPVPPETPMADASEDESPVPEPVQRSFRPLSPQKVTGFPLTRGIEMPLRSEEPSDTAHFNKKD